MSISDKKIGVLWCLISMAAAAKLGSSTALLEPKAIERGGARPFAVTIVGSAGCRPGWLLLTSLLVQTMILLFLVAVIQVAIGAASLQACCIFQFPGVHSVIATRTEVCKTFWYCCSLCSWQCVALSIHDTEGTNMSS